ncbi:ribosomal protein L11 methyltransferase [Bacillus sp. FJAT-27916]|uniref:50S ribosomal protein L11 methyltransferase n=1 Tax=Bacillaceae TaxID=186817 RepID=UPI000670A401|nr:50S ribosomal protein L11 methyltransferase [Bacillus sp. FJAT-27916]KMY46343.1 ribosomal protein L11 methyltransferase [Bacillus sp. FJAT-27916]
MKWSELCIHTTNEAVEPISNILHEAGASGVVIEDPLELVRERENVFGEIYQLDPNDFPDEGVIVKAYLPVNSFLGETVDGIKDLINNLVEYDIDLGANKVTISEVNEEEWATAWKKYYHPVKISEQITIVPTWEEYTPVSSDEKIIELDPGMAFGTGTHPTTILCIQALEKQVKPGMHIIDVGTGSGVLTIAAAKYGAEEILALDLDEVAVNSAKINCKLNKVHDKVTIKQNDLLKEVDFEADIIVANILAEVIVRFTDDVERLLKPGGRFISSGIIKQKRAEVEEAIKNSGLIIEEVMTMEDWVSITAVKQ